eukprot:2996178-Amphidinium_carterae.2
MLMDCIDAQGLQKLAAMSWQGRITGACCFNNPQMQRDPFVGHRHPISAKMSISVLMTIVALWSLYLRVPSSDLLPITKSGSWTLS